jgi:HPt (histidine-containing phosphotransfer) domain-containing protein
MTGGSLTAYKQILSMFCKDAQDRLPLLQKAPEAEALPTFITQVHALKSASSSLGAKELSTVAAELEAAGKNGNMEIIFEKLPAFAKNLSELITNIHAVLEQDSAPQDDDNDKEIDITAYIPAFRELSGALQSQKIPDIKRILNTLGQQTQNSKLKDILEQISDQVFMTEFGSAVKIVDSLLKGKNNN